MIGDKILVVDDEKAVRDTFVASFDEYRIITAANGQKALDVLKSPNDIDLIILDVEMPDILGTELLKEIKMINPALKVIIITGHSSKEVAIEALRADADEYIEKPFDVGDVKEQIERQLQNKDSPNKEDRDLSTKVKLVQKFIARNYNRSLHLKDVAREVSLCPKYFSRMFKEKTGKNFSEHKINLKLKTAKQLLRKNNYTVSQIAYRVGYQNPESFMKIFKRFVGITPSEYRHMATRKRGSFIA